MAGDDIILYHYVYSPFAKRIVWYLQLRGIPYSQCLQPPIMPRPDVARLGIAYRRIPLLGIGRDVYLDTRLQLQKLEQMFPSLPRLGSGDADAKAVEQLMSSFVIEGGVFTAAAALLPSSLPLLKDPKFLKDRAQFSGGAVSREAAVQRRSEALLKMTNMFSLLETTLLADGRDWILKTPTPSLADIEAVWPLDWLINMPGALPKDRFSPAVYPKVYAWVQRFQAATEAAAKKLSKPQKLSGEEAAKAIFGSAFHESDPAHVDAGDGVVLTQGLKQGDVVTLWPTDTGMSHKDVGKLVGVNAGEVVLETQGEGGSVRVHAPRTGFRLVKGDGRSSEHKL